MMLNPNTFYLYINHVILVLYLVVLVKEGEKEKQETNLRQVQKYSLYTFIMHAWDSRFQHKK